MNEEIKKHPEMVMELSYLFMHVIKEYPQTYKGSHELDEYFYDSCFFALLFNMAAIYVGSGDKLSLDELVEYIKENLALLIKQLKDHPEMLS
jgi:hypothetical protein